MKPRWLRLLYYRATNPLMWLNGRWYRHVRAPRRGLKVHLGPGQNNYLAGWLNVDANVVTAKIDLWANILHGLPFRNGSVGAFYTYHVIEHFPYDRVLDVLREMHRCLEPHGVVRIGVPHVGNAARAYAAGRADWFGNFPRAHQSLGGKLANFVLCVNEHQQMFDYGFLAELLVAAGFQELSEWLPSETGHPAVFDQAVLSLEEEPTPDLPHTLVVEAVKHPQ